MKKQFQAFGKRLARYFRAYGGARAMFGSPLFIVSLLITVVNYSNWLQDHWTDESQSLIPSLLGFSLGTYAILFSLITSRLKRALKAVKNDRNVSYLEELNATFFHFIFVQVIALLWAFLFRATLLTDAVAAIAPRIPEALVVFMGLYAVGSFLGFFLLVYSFLLILGAALGVYRLASIIDPEAE